MLGNLGDGCVMCMLGTRAARPCSRLQSAGYLQQPPLPLDVRRLSLDMHIFVSSGTARKFRRSYDTRATLTLTGALAKAIQKAGLRPGEKSNGIKYRDLENIL